MSILKTETAATIFFTAIMTSIGALIVSPVSISLGFWLNDYLARPVMSIEYVEIIPEKKQFQVPARELSKLIMSSYFQSIYMRNNTEKSNLLISINNEQNLSEGKSSKLKSVMSEYVVLINDRYKKFKKYYDILNTGQLQEEILREIALDYWGHEKSPPASSMEDLSKMKDALINNIGKEINTTENNLAQAENILTIISDWKPDQIENVFMKVSVINKGNTDGLIRAIGQIYIPKENLELSIKNISPPNKKNKMAIAVTIADELPSPPSSNSVGKIEMHTLKEIWYKVENNYKVENEFRKFTTYLNSHDNLEIKVSLYDHEKKLIQKKFNVSI